MVTIYRNHQAETATVIVKSNHEEMLCVDKYGQFIICDIDGENLYEIGRDDALEVADWWGADPELIAKYFGDEGAQMVPG